MSDNQENKLFEKLNKYFNKNIKISFVMKKYIIIITNEDRVYAFERSCMQCFAIVICSDESKFVSLIEDMIVTELCEKNIIDIKCNHNYHTYIYFITNTGTLYSWRNRFEGEIPVLMEKLINKNIIDICRGDSHAVVLTSDGRVFEWSDNGVKYNLFEEIEPKQLNYFNSEKIIAISCGAYHSLALTERGLVYGWGHNHSQQIDCKSKSKYIFPPVIMSDIMIRNMCCGHKASYLLSNDGIIYVYGKYAYNNFGKTIIKIDEKIKFIYCDSSSDERIIFGNKINIYILGKFGELEFREPYITQLYCIENVFMHYLGINHKPIRNVLNEFKNYFIYKTNYENNYNKLDILGKGSYGKVYKVEQILNDKVIDESQFEEELDNGEFNQEVYKQYEREYIKTGIPIGEAELKSLGGEFGRTYKDDEFIYEEIKLFAVKQINYSSDNEMIFINEIITCPIIMKIKSEYLVRYHDIWIERNSMKNINYFDSTLYIRMDLCDVSLESLIIDIKNNNNLFINNMLTNIGFYITSEIFYQILNGAKFLHSHSPQIIHRDLNPFNILIKFQKKVKNFVKIADFGLSTIHKISGQSWIAHSSDVGHYRYIAPEVHCGNNYDTRADIYSLGIVCKILFSLNIKRKHSADSSDILTKKYENIQTIYKKMTNVFVESRFQSVQQIIALKQLWALNERDFDLKLILKSCAKNNSIYEKSILTILYHLIGFINFVHIFSTINIQKIISSEDYIIILTNDGNVSQIWREELFNKLTNKSKDKIFNMDIFIANCVIKKLINKYVFDVKSFQKVNDYNFNFAFTKNGNTYYWDNMAHKIPKMIIKNENIQAITLIANHYTALLAENNLIYVLNHNSFKISSIRINTSNLLESISALDRYSNILFGITKSGCVYRIKKNNVIPIAEYINDEYGIDFRNIFSNIVFKKICCGNNYCLLLSNNGIIYSFGDNIWGQLGADNSDFHFNIIEHSERFSDIAANYDKCMSIALSQKGNVYVWGEIEEKKYVSPKLTKFKSINEAFTYFFNGDYSNYENQISVKEHYERCG